MYYLFVWNTYVLVQEACWPPTEEPVVGGSWPIVCSKCWNPLLDTQCALVPPIFIPRMDETANWVVPETPCL